VVAVLDVYDALIHDRIYRPALPETEALAMLQAERGRHFEPRIFDAFLAMLPDLRDIARG
jgi:putative two-component system response regulator|tara:strand:+ start:1421 stop:1600 length:180 start_codon:yes stop_codon:yes gene_type:complete